MAWFIFYLHAQAAAAVIAMDELAGHQSKLNTSASDGLVSPFLFLQS